MPPFCVVSHRCNSKIGQVLIKFRLTEQLAELTATLIGPPGVPGRGKPGRAGPAGPSGPQGKQHLTNLNE